MKLGMFMMPLHPPAKDRTACFDEDIEQVVRGEALGFTEAWIGQHHSVAWEPIPSNDLFIANLLPRTSTIRLGTGVSILPHHHPVNVAVRLAFSGPSVARTHQRRLRTERRADRLGTVRPARSRYPGADDPGGDGPGHEAVAERGAV